MPLKNTCKRRNNKQTLDISVISPSGKKLHSNPELYNYLEDNPEVKCDRSVTNTSRPSCLPILAQKTSEKDFRMNFQNYEIRKQYV